MSSLNKGRPSSTRTDDAFERAVGFDSEPDIQADYARYLCILVTGFLEQAVVRVILNYVDAVGDPSLSRYVAETLRRPGSMQAGEIMRLVGSFNEDWRTQLEKKLTTRHRDAIGSVYASRNKIAHGEDVDLAYRQVRDDYHLVREAVDFLEETVA